MVNVELYVSFLPVILPSLSLSIPYPSYSAATLYRLCLSNHMVNVGAGGFQKAK